MMKQFRSSLFGYSKQSVNAYITQLNEEFSQKLLEKEQEGREAAGRLREEVERLRQENARLRAERQTDCGDRP